MRNVQAVIREATKVVRNNQVQDRSFEGKARRCGDELDMGVKVEAMCHPWVGAASRD